MVSNNMLEDVFLFLLVTSLLALFPPDFLPKPCGGSNIFANSFPIFVFNFLSDFSSSLINACDIFFAVASLILEIIFKSLLFRL